MEEEYKCRLKVDKNLINGEKIKIIEDMTGIQTLVSL